MRRLAVSTRQVLARHSWAIGLMESRASPGPTNLRHREAVTACLLASFLVFPVIVLLAWLLTLSITLVWRRNVPESPPSAT